MRKVLSILLVSGSVAAAWAFLRDDAPGPGVSGEVLAGQADPALEEVSARDEAERLFAEGQASRAYDAYLRVIDETPDDASAHARLGLLALLRYETALVRTHGAEVTRLAPGSPEDLAIAAALRAYSGDGAADAVAQARRVLDESPDQVIARLAAAQGSQDLGDPCGALVHLDSAIADAPPFYELEELKLSILQKAGDRAAALRQLEHMHRKFPESATVTAWLLDAYRSRGDTEAVAELMREAARNSGDDLGPRLDLVEYVRATQGDEAASRELARLAEESQGTPAAGPLLLEQGMDLLRQGRAAEAVVPLKAVVALTETSPTTANDAKAALARALHAQGDAQAAAKLADEVLAGDAGHVPTLKLQAEWLIGEGQPDEALRKLQLASAQEPLDAGIQTLQAQVYEMMGDDAMAGSALVRAREMSNGGAAETALLVEFLQRRGKDAAANAVLSSEEDADDVAEVQSASVQLSDEGRPVCPAP